MKKFAFALMAVATLAMVACNKKDEPKNNTGGGGDDDDDPTFVSKISVRDNSIADWANVPAQYLVEAKCPEDALFTAMKSVKVYADQQYINVLMEYDPSQFGVDAAGEDDWDWLPVHMYINADNSDATGGYDDEFTDGNAEVLLEGGIYSQKEAIDYDPAYFKWWGNGIDDTRTGWLWTDPTKDEAWLEANKWGAVIATGEGGIGKSQEIGGKGMVEIQIMREMIPVTWHETTFTIGFDIQSHWNSNGVLPQGPENAGAQGKVAKLVITIDPTFYE